MSVRLECIRACQKILEEKVFFKDLKDGFDEKSRPFAGYLILTALRRKPVIDKLLASILSKKIKGKDKVLNYVLLLGAVEILYMNTPSYAALNEYVDASKKLVGTFASKMVNAVLHKIEKYKDDMQNKAEFPDAFKEILLQDYTTAEIKKMQEMLLCEAPLDITAVDPVQTASDLGGILFENGTVRLQNVKVHPSLLKGYDEGLWFVQDLAAALPLSMLSNLRDKKVLDLCAAPGGKTAQLLLKGADVTALDIDEKRLQKLKENMKRLHLEKNLSVVCEDAFAFLKKVTEKYDFILIDAPCSATGTFRKHPEIMYFKTLKDVQKQAEIQKELLNASMLCLKEQGQILYVTCSISKTEGEQQIKDFLNMHENFELMPIEKKNMTFETAEKIDERIFNKGVLRTLPYHEQSLGGMDSFFAAGLKKKG